MWGREKKTTIGQGKGGLQWLGETLLWHANKMIPNRQQMWLAKLKTKKGWKGSLGLDLDIDYTKIWTAFLWPSLQPWRADIYHHCFHQKSGPEGQSLSSTMLFMFFIVAVVFRQKWEQKRTKKDFPGIKKKYMQSFALTVLTIDCTVIYSEKSMFPIFQLHSQKLVDMCPK